MLQTNNSLRIKTNVGEDKYISVNLEHEYDVLEVLSLKIDQKNDYVTHNSDYGILVGRVIANNGIGVPNAHLSLFIEKKEGVDVIKNVLYPYETVRSKDSDGRRYNLLFDKQKNDCHQVIGTFPNKRLVLDDSSVLEVFDEYYKYTTRTNDAGDYMFFGVPVGTYNLHMDLDISDCGKLSQRPRDFVYKGYTIDQFENPNQFKIDTELDSLSQLFTQDVVVEVKPFWGDENSSSQIGISVQYINVSFKFEPTCVFMGSVVTDGANEGLSRKCVPSTKMGEMESMVSGSGTIEIIRKRFDGEIEELQIKGTQLVNGDGVWCFQIPMNLDYVMTDEYGNLVPTDNPEKGIPTRCDVRFRLSLDEPNHNTVSYNRGKVLIPHNPKNESEVDYNFGTKTLDSSFKTLMWNNVYTIKSFIPRFQKAKKVLSDKFTGIKMVNNSGGNNPMPYNNIRIELPFMFTVVCALTKAFIGLVSAFNWVKKKLMSALGNIADLVMPYTYISSGEFCPDLDSWYFAPNMEIPPLAGGNNRICRQWPNQSVCETYKDIANTVAGDTFSTVEYYKLNLGGFVDNYDSSKTYLVKYVDDDGDEIVFYEYITDAEYNLLSDSYNVSVYSDGIVTIEKTDLGKGKLYILTDEKDARLSPKDNKSIDVLNALDNTGMGIHLTPNTDYLLQCVETKLAAQYNVIKFDFYNDWLNGCVYMPRWARSVNYKKKTKHGETIITPKVKGCMNNTEVFRTSRRYFQQCSLQYDANDYKLYENQENGCGNGKMRCHTNAGRTFIPVFGNKSGVVNETPTLRGEYVYYLKPSEFQGNKRIPLFATDIVMLGTLFDCNEYGLPSTFDSLRSTTYQMPPQLAMTNIEDDSDGYVGNDGPSAEVIKTWNCNEKCNKGGIAVHDFIDSGVTKKMLSYEEIDAALANIDAITGGDGVLDYEDVFPVTEISGVDWGYDGVGYGDDIRKGLLSPGGHFMGLSCFVSETNIKSCVNLKRACEIGTTLSERLEIEAGYSEKESTDGNSFDVVNYLFVAPNGLIAKDQINDVTFRSAFATMNQNSLRTKENSRGYKEYDFEYLLPDSFDGILSDKLEGYTKQLKPDEKAYWGEYIEKLKADGSFNKEIDIEQGNTIIRGTEVASKDYIKFRLGDKPTFLIENGEYRSMPVYENSFYFYFGLRDGATALDEFKKQFYAKCNKNVIVEQVGDMSVKVVETNGKINVNKDMTFNIEVDVNGLEPQFTYTLKRLDYDNFKVYPGVQISVENLMNSGSTDVLVNRTGTENSHTFIIKNVEYGTYSLTVMDENEHLLETVVYVGKDMVSIDYDDNDVISYFSKVSDEVENKLPSDDPILSDGGYVSSNLTAMIGSDYQLSSNLSLNILIKKKDVNEGVMRGDNNWGKRYQAKTKRFYVWGPSEYEVWIMVYDINTRKCYSSYKHSSFIIGEGSDVDLMFYDGIMSEIKYEFPKKPSTWWDETILTPETDVTKEQYRYVVNYENDGFSIPISCVGGHLIYCCQGEAYNESTGEKDVTEKYGIITEASYLDGDNMSYDYNNVTIFMNDSVVKNKGPFYFTACNDDGTVWGTKTCGGDITETNYGLILKSNNEEKESYNDIISYLQEISDFNASERELMSRFLLQLSNGKVHMVQCAYNTYEKGIVIGKSLDCEQEELNEDIAGNMSDCRLVHLMLVPYYSKPYTSKIIVYMEYGRSINENIYQANCYKNQLKITSDLNKDYNAVNIIWGENPWDELGMLGSKETVTINCESSFAVGGDTIESSEIITGDTVHYLGFGSISTEDYKNFNEITSLIEGGYLENEIDTLSLDGVKYIFEVTEWDNGKGNIIYLVNKLGETEKQNV